MNTFDASPKTIGEILDRAIATYVGAVVPLFAIAAFAVIPTLLVELAVLPGFAQLFSGAGTMLPGSAAGVDENARILRALQHGSTIGALVLVFATFVLTYTLANTTLFGFLAAKLDGAPIAIPAAYRAALPRWVGQIVVSLAYIAFALVAYVAFAVLAGLVALVIFALNTLSHAVAIAAGIILGVLAFGVLVAGFALLYIAWQMTAAGVAIEDANPIRAIGRGMRRALDRSLLRRSLLVAVALVAIDLFGTLVFIAFGALTASLVHVPFASAAIMSVGGIVLWGVRAAFVLVYARDVRLRREGSDLLAMAGEALAPA